MDTPTSKELKKVKNKRQLEIRDAFVTFEHEESRERCVEDYRAYLESDRRFSRMFCCVRWRPSHIAMPDKLKVKCGSGGGREAVAVEEVDVEPEDVIWENVSTAYSSWIVSTTLQKHTSCGGKYSLCRSGIQKVWCYGARALAR